MKVEFKCEDEDEQGRSIGPVFIDGIIANQGQWVTLVAARLIADRLGAEFEDF